MEAADIVMRLKHRFSGSAYVVLEQVPDATGYGVSRYLDVAVFSMWPSRGLTRSAFEVKVSRQDMLNELNTPAKHQWAYECFHEFWFVAPGSIVSVEELPTWAGLMIPHGKQLRIVRQATHNDTPKINDFVLASFMRAAVNGARKENKEHLLALPEYQRAAMYQMAAEKILADHKRIFYSGPDGVEDIITALTTLDLGEKTMRDRDHLLGVLSRFQSEMAGLFGLFALIASRSLLAKDALGEYTVKIWGGHHLDSLKEIKEYKKGVYGDQGAYYRIVEQIMEWVPPDLLTSLLDKNLGETDK